MKSKGFLASVYSRLTSVRSPIPKYADVSSCILLSKTLSSDVLEKKNARVSLQQIIRELESTQDQIWSPVILNGTGFGLFANHSLVMASYISRANAAIIDLRELLSRG